MNITLQGPFTGIVVAALGLFLLFAPMTLLTQRRSPVVKHLRSSTPPAPLWMKLFFRGLGVLLLALAAALLWPS